MVRVEGFEDIVHEFFVPNINEFVVLYGIMHLDEKKEMPKWREERDSYLFKGTISDQNLREILSSEVVIEFDFLNKNIIVDSDEFRKIRLEAEQWIEKVKQWLLKKDVFFYITDHKGKSPHIHFHIADLHGIEKNICSNYKEKIAEQILKDIKFKSNTLTIDRGLINSATKLISMECKPHWKKVWNGNVESIIFSNNDKDLMKIEDSLMEMVVEESFKKKKESSKITLNKNVVYEKILSFFQHHYMVGNRNNFILAFGGMCVREGLPLEESISVLKNVLEELGENDINTRIKEMRYSYEKGKDGVAVFHHLLNVSKEKSIQMMKELKECFMIDKKDLNKIQCTTENIILLIDSKMRAKATDLVVEEFISHNKIFTIRNDIKNEIWIYKDGIYIPEGKTYIRQFCRKLLKERFTEQFVNQIFDKIRADTYVDYEDFFINEDLNKIPVLNGIFDLSTYVIEPFSDKYRFFNKLPINYDKEVLCPNIIKFFNSVLKEEKDVKTIQEIFGYLLFRENRFEKAFMFVGVNKGRNGKGKTLKLMERFIGGKNITNMSLQNLSEVEFELSELHNKMANIGGDISHEQMEHTETFLKLTGRDSIIAKRKFLTPVKFVNYAKLIFSTNATPDLNESDTDDFFNRWEIINFPFRFVTKEQYEKRKENPNIKLRDPVIIDKITTEKEISGLFNWAIEGLKRLMTNGDFSSTTSEDEIKETWKQKSSSFNIYVEDYIETDDNYSIAKKELKQQYKKFCKDNDLKVISDKKIYMTLTENLDAIIKKVTIEEKQERVWEGIRFKEGKEGKNLHNTNLIEVNKSW